jgi:hypothetical protein
MSALHRWVVALATAAITALAVVTTPATAGQTCEDQPLSSTAVTSGMRLADAVQKRLNATGADVVVLARAGQDLSRWRLRWSHLGFAYRDTGGDKPVWRVVHKLNACGTAQGDLHRQGLGEFFLDRPHRYEAAFVVLSPAAQAALKPVLRDNARLVAMHTPAYNMVAYPWSTQYQQSNQWALEVLAGAMNPGLTSRREAQRWLQARAYEPTVLSIDTFTRLGARVGMAHIAFDDHPAAKRFADRIETVTVDSVFDWLRIAGFGDAVVTVR